MSPTPMSVDRLLDQAHLIDTGRIRRLALGVRTAAIELDNAVVHDATIKRVAVLRSELERLETILGAPGGRVADYDPATVRAWAKANGMDAPTRGRYLPIDLVTAWRKATA